MLAGLQNQETFFLGQQHSLPRHHVQGAVDLT